METWNYFVDNWSTLQSATFQHLRIMSLAVTLSILTAVPIGISITHRPKLARIVLYIAGMIMTIPSVAMFGIMIPIFAVINQGIGLVPAVAALVLYAQLPIIRNTYTAVLNVDDAIVEAGRGMGMTRRQILRRIQIPLALPVIMAGVRTAVVINIGVATISALIGAGGLGRVIYRGISRTYGQEIIAGAIVVSILAILTDTLLGALEKRLVPKGLRVDDSV